MDRNPPREEDAMKVWLYMNEARFNWKAHVDGKWTRLKHEPWNDEPEKPKKGIYTFHRLKLKHMDLKSQADPIKKELPGKDAITIKLLHATTEKGVDAILTTGRVTAMPYNDKGAEVNHTVVYGQGGHMNPHRDWGEENAREMARIAHKASLSGHNWTGLAFELQATGHHTPLKNGGVDKEQDAIKANDNAICSMNGRWSVHERNQTISAIWIIGPVQCSRSHAAAKHFADHIPIRVD
jgi:hypothetical protein